LKAFWNNKINPENY
jgi:hypothetical protein